MMIEIGIPKIDDFLKGGLPVGKSLLYYIHPGVEGDIFGMQTLYTNLQKGYKCVCITATASPDTLRERYREYDFNLEKYDDNFDIIDAYSALIGADSSEKYIVKNPEDIKNIDKVINEAIEDSRGGLIVHGSLSNIMDMCGEEETLQYIDGWNKNMLLYDSVGIYNFTAWPYSDDTIKKVRDEFFNAVVKVGGIAEKVIFGQYYSVSKSDWINGNLGHSILFKILKPGGNFFHGELNAKAIEGDTEGENYYITIIRDVSTQKYLFEQLNKSQKMFQLVLDNIPQLSVDRSMN